MIEIIENEKSENTEKCEPVITDQLALAAVGVLRDFCKDKECNKCILKYIVCENCESPRDWEI